jgi:hypothetical protein
LSLSAGGSATPCHAISCCFVCFSFVIVVVRSATPCD